MQGKIYPSKSKLTLLISIPKTMENLAYIYAAQAYSSHWDSISSLDALDGGRDLPIIDSLYMASIAQPTPYIEPKRTIGATGIGKFLAGLKQSRLSSLAWIRWLAVAQSLLILSIAEEAIAALQKGSIGPTVSCVQQVLKGYGYYHGPIDGLYGSETEVAVRKYEGESSGISDGNLKDSTLARMGCIPYPIAIERSPRPRALLHYPRTPLPYPRTPFPQPTVVLSVGCDSEAVKRLQLTLRARGYFGGPITGYYGQQTKLAVMRFQQDYGLVVDGIAGPMTLAALPGTRVLRWPVAYRQVEYFYVQYFPI